MVIDLLLIGIIAVIIIDLSGFIQNVKKGILKILKKPQQEFSIKPFDCSFCTTHWVGLIYLIFTGKITLASYALLLGICFITPIIKDVLVLLKDILNKFIDLIYFCINK